MQLPYSPLKLLQATVVSTLLPNKKKKNRPLKDTRMNSGQVAFICPNTQRSDAYFLGRLLRKKSGERKRVVGWRRQTDVAGGLKCSSRDLTLEFAGNRTELRRPEGRGWLCVQVCMCGGACPYESSRVFGVLVVSVQVCLNARTQRFMCCVCSAHPGSCVFVCVCTCS